MKDNYNKEFDFVENHRNFIPIKKRSKPTKYIVVHCSATENLSRFDWKSIDQMHRARGFSMVGYHFIIKKDGTIQKGRDLGAIGAHAVGFNNESVGICLIGGVNSKNESVDNFTKEQKESLIKLLDCLKIEYPSATVLGHKELPNVAKDCPCFDVKSFYRKHEKSYVEYNGEPIESISNLSKADFIAINGTYNPELKSIIRVK